MNIKKHFIVLGLVAGLVAPAFAEKKDHEDKDEKIALSSTPAAVQATIAANLGKGTLGDIEVETEKGVTTYEAEIKLPNGKELELKIAADGKLLKSKVETDDKDDDKK